MSEIMFIKRLLHGNSRRKVREIVLSISNLEQISDLEWSYRVIVTGGAPRDNTMKACSSFDTVVSGMSFLRQSLRAIVSENPKTKFYEDLDGELFEVEIDTVFGTEDCVPEDVEQIREWAKKKGFDPDSEW